MSLNDDIALLSSVPLFADIDQEKLRLIAFGAERRRVSAGQELFREGAPADCAYAVSQGRFRLTRIGVDGRLETVGSVERGTLLSELAMISLVARKLTATAEEESEALRIPRALFHRMLEEYPDVAVLVETRLRNNLQAMIADAASLAPRFG
ncbi:protein kinase [Xaviernesmea oryzae]|uniref:Protein kinase n=1 Tax=Xaviernesmea oryzae TaxID=464029 RepID=A0A1Q9AXN8_9HYPH|nr:cyclic nucleotide-binding domain-containing protein [Xaviernesmea oryzae]OLP60198.1 protein kinase [Xaviernesmea oryzae]SEK29001.1 Cyclic nucleotide-binding domain-containing protein [Xaviernesmea oryzae]